MKAETPFGFFMRVHKATLKERGSQNVYAATLPRTRIPEWFDPDGEAWFKPMDDIMRQYGYVPMRIVYKDARDLPVDFGEQKNVANLVDGNETRH